MKKIIAIVVTFLGLISVAGPKIDEAVLQDVKTNKAITINQLKGKKTYIKMWASWCPVCLGTLDDVNKLSKEKNLDFNVITVVSPSYLGEKDKESFKKWWKGLPEYKDITVLFDNDALIAKKIGVRAYPTNIFLNSKGEVVKSVPGALSNNVIKATLKGIK